MKKKLGILAAFALLGLIAANVVGAQSAYAPATHTATSKASKNKAGTKKKPAPFVGTWHYDVKGEFDRRAPKPENWTWKWNNVAVNQKGIPVCTAEEIDAAQSDADCPKGSLIGTGNFAALLGPTTDPGTSIGCTGKTLRFYNGAKGKMVWFIVGPPEGCAGLVYLAPFEVNLSTKKGTTSFSLDFPSNIVEPLPGIEGGLSFIDAKYVKKVKAGKKKLNYMQSTKCKGNRQFSMAVTDSEGLHSLKANAGKCG